MAQFFIVRKFKNKAVGRYVAHQCFRKFSGEWEVMVLPRNEGAYRFWRAIIKDYSVLILLNIRVKLLNLIIVGEIFLNLTVKINH